MYIVRVISLIKVLPQISGANTKECYMERSSQQIRNNKHPPFCTPLHSVLVYECKRVMKIVHTLTSHCFFVSYLASNVLKTFFYTWTGLRLDTHDIALLSELLWVLPLLKCLQRDRNNPVLKLQSAAAELRSARGWAPSKHITDGFETLFMWSHFRQHSISECVFSV